MLKNWNKKLSEIMKLKEYKKINMIRIHYNKNWTNHFEAHTDNDDCFEMILDYPNNDIVEFKDGSADPNYGAYNGKFNNHKVLWATSLILNKGEWENYPDIIDHILNIYLTDSEIKQEKAPN
ncbi:hypothetical protein [Spiroplasma attinicola]|uniref:hypothetical protein n=1 Tax=Spiroplasma attinicola TaxID=2904537 RepID=UPI002022A2AD|nr:MULTISPECIES: hypothetical protein [unclassified Spiroplasma]MCL8209468.1 hypothetical protein [Spiroplasma sp. JKS002670]MCL8210287.1 hypothetical protein [Spiroplasma sp. JKS002671]